MIKQIMSKFSVEDLRLLLSSSSNYLREWLSGDGGRTAVSIGYVTGAVIVGLVSVYLEVLLSWMFTWTKAWWSISPFLSLLICPLMFLIASNLIFLYAPYAGGSGIPQVLKATELSVQGADQSSYKPLVSVRGSFFKTLSVCAGILGGASIGREGPTVQISASIFQIIARGLSKAGAKLTFHSFLVCGASAGIAAAFNTPLAGITFALEELAGSIFSRIRQVIILAIIVAGLVARSLAGNYLYFGRTDVRVTGDIIITLEGIGIGALCGLAGVGFVATLLSCRKWVFSFTPNKRRIHFPILAGLIVGTLAMISAGRTLGTGYEPASQFLTGDLQAWRLDEVILFPFAKIIATVLSFVSGMAGGIFAPSLSIGASLGGLAGHLLSPQSIAIFSLLGMAAFLSAVTQAPLTAFIIVMEMTAEHGLILPLMACALTATGVSKLLGFAPIYHTLANFISLPETSKPPVSQEQDVLGPPSPGRQL